MWIVETETGIIEFDTEDQAWEYVMRLEINHVPGASKLVVAEYVEDDFLDLA